MSKKDLIKIIEELTRRIEVLERETSYINDRLAPPRYFGGSKGEK